MADGLRARIRAGEPLLGVFVKTASHQVVELLGRVGLDFAIVDAEHAPFDLLTLDRMCAAARASALPLLIRPPTADAAFTGQALDMGFDGVVAPHVTSRRDADRLADAVKYSRGRRGFSPSTRAGGYGAPDAAAYRAAADASSQIWLQIEDREAIDAIDDIAAAGEADCLFVGRADLAQSLGVEKTSDPAVEAAALRVAAAGRAAGRAVGIFVSSPSEIGPFREAGVSVFVCGSDQSWLLSEGRRIRSLAPGL